jgi:hypothetical protein
VAPSCTGVASTTHAVTGSAALVARVRKSGSAGGPSSETRSTGVLEGRAPGANVIATRSEPSWNARDASPCGRWRPRSEAKRVSSAPLVRTTGAPGSGVARSVGTSSRMTSRSPSAPQAVAAGPAVVPTGRKTRTRVASSSAAKSGSPARSIDAPGRAGTSHATRSPAGSTAICQRVVRAPSLATATRTAVGATPRGEVPSVPLARAAEGASATSAAPTATREATSVPGRGGRATPRQEQPACRRRLARAARKK